MLSVELSASDEGYKWQDFFQGQVTSRVSQGGILPPYLFNVYVGKLSEKLEMYNVGCSMKGRLINRMMRADDFVLMSPSTARLCQLLHKCEQFGISHDVKYNGTKSEVGDLKRMFIHWI